MSVAREYRVRAKFVFEGGFYVLASMSWQVCREKRGNMSRSIMAW